MTIRNSAGGFLYLLLAACGSGEPITSTSEIPMAQMNQPFPEYEGVKPSGGMVPDASTAKVIAEASIPAIVGKRSYDEHQTFEVRQIGNVWLVQGNRLGQGIEVRISKENGKVSVPRQEIKPKMVVPDASTAIKISEAVLTPIYGKRAVEEERPYSAVIDDNKIWTVTGWLEPDVDGGVAEVKINAFDGEISRIEHGK